MERAARTRPDQLLAYRPLAELLRDKPAGGFSIQGSDTALQALREMARRDIGFLIVLEGERFVGVLSERDCARKLEVNERAAAATAVRDIMSTDVVSIAPDDTIPHCMTVMDSRGFRHLPVIDGERVVGVISMRDLVREIVRHHEQLIRELALERLTTVEVSPSGY